MLAYTELIEINKVSISKPLLGVNQKMITGHEIIGFESVIYKVYRKGRTKIRYYEHGGSYRRESIPQWQAQAEAMVHGLMIAWDISLLRLFRLDVGGSTF